MEHKTNMNTAFTQALLAILTLIMGLVPMSGFSVRSTCCLAGMPMSCCVQKSEPLQLDQRLQKPSCCQTLSKSFNFPVSKEAQKLVNTDLKKLITIPTDYQYTVVSSIAEPLPLVYARVNDLPIPILYKHCRLNT